VPHQEDGIHPIKLQVVYGKNKKSEHREKSFSLGKVSLSQRTKGGYSATLPQRFVDDGEDGKFFAL